MAYRVVIADGPAQGWSYVTFVPPDPIIAIAPAREDFPQGEWMRVVAGAPEPWPGQLDYERGRPANGRCAGRRGRRRRRHLLREAGVTGDAHAAANHVRGELTTVMDTIRARLEDVDLPVEVALLAVQVVVEGPRADGRRADAPRERV
jgi:hypothetical protein